MTDFALLTSSRLHNGLQTVQSRRALRVWLSLLLVAPTGATIQAVMASSSDSWRGCSPVRNRQVKTKTETGPGTSAGRAVSGENQPARYWCGLRASDGNRAVGGEEI